MTGLAETADRRRRRAARPLRRHAAQSPAPARPRPRLRAARARRRRGARLVIVGDNRTIPARGSARRRRATLGHRRRGRGPRPGSPTRSSRDLYAHRHGLRLALDLRGLRAAAARGDGRGRAGRRLRHARSRARSTARRRCWWRLAGDSTRHRRARRPRHRAGDPARAARGAASPAPPRYSWTTTARADASPRCARRRRDAR